MYVTADDIIACYVRPRWQQIIEITPYNLRSLMEADETKVRCWLLLNIDGEPEMIEVKREQVGDRTRAYVSSPFIDRTYLDTLVD